MIDIEIKKPNVVCIIMDDTDFKNIGCYGGKVLTPNLDRIAEKGVKFTQAYCTASVCTASRYSYLTGHYNGRCPDRHFLNKNPVNDVYAITWNSVLNETMPGIGTVLSQNGYQTAYCGKWHCGRPRTEMNIPNFEPDDDPDDPEVDKKLKKFQQILVDEVKNTGGFQYASGIIWGNNEEMPVNKLCHHNLEWVTDGALKFLDSADTEKPFFLYVAYTTFHGPPHQESFAQDPVYTQGGKVKGFDFYDRASLKPRLDEKGLPFNHKQIGMTWTDDMIGIIQEKLNNKGIEDSTVFIYQTDHNTEPGKGTCYNTGIRIPMLMKWANKIPAGIECHSDIQNIDFAPTLFDICKIAPPDNMELDGRSYLNDIIEDKTTKRDDMFFEMGYTRAVMTKKWKYIAFRYPKSLIHKIKNSELKEAPNHFNMRMQGQALVAMEHYPGYWDADQLYDLENDPDEMNNLAEKPEYADILVKMKERLKKYLDTFKHPFDLEDTEFMRSEQFQKLKHKTMKIGTKHIPWWPKPEKK